MSTHKDLPPGSQQWARELDDALKEIKKLQGVVTRLSENAGLDMANPRRGLNDGPTPSVKNPVGQKLSSLADVATYNVSDKQVLGWSQAGQKWLPVTLPNPSGAVAIPMAYDGDAPLTGYGQFDTATNTWAYTGTNPLGDVETWATRTMYIGAGNWDTGPVALVTLAKDGFHRPYVEISASDFTDGSISRLEVYSYAILINGAYFVVQRVTTAGRPAGLDTRDQQRGAMVFDIDLNIPIWWNGTTWINALGTAV